MSAQSADAFLERWPGYNKQSWQERFKYLDGMRQDEMERMTALIKGKAKASARHALQNHSIAQVAEDRADLFEREGHAAAAVWALRVFASDIRAGILDKNEDS